MDQATIQRYQPGGDIYQALLAQGIGAAGANAVAQAALTGDETQVNAALTQAQFGNPLNTSTASILTNQLLTDPLAAPLSGLNNVLGNSFASLLKNPYVLLALAAVIFFFVFDGVSIIKRNFK